MINFKTVPLIVIGCGLLLILVGATVLTGWLTNNATLVQITPSLPPMEFNTALCFGLSGFCLILMISKQYWLMRILGVVVGMFAIINGVEYLTGMNIGIDTLFVNPFIVGVASAPGRMAPGSCLGLTLACIAFFLPAKENRFLTTRMLCLALLGSLIASLGLSPFLIHFAGMDAANTWHGFTHMSIHTIYCMIILGVAFICYAFERKSNFAILLPLPIFCGMLCAVFSLSYAIKSYEDVKFLRIVSTENLNSAQSFSQYLSNLYDALNRIRKRWEAQEGTQKIWWEKDASAYAHDFPTIVALAWVNNQNVLQWIVPKSPLNATLINIRYDSEPERAATLNRAFQTNMPQITKVVRLITDKKLGFIYLTPLMVNGKNDGYLLAALKIDDMVNKLFQNSIFKNFYLVIKENNKIIFNNLPTENEHLQKWQAIYKISINSQPWTFTLIPTKSYLLTKNSNIPFIVVIVGVFVSLITALAIFLGLKSWQTSNALRSSEERLKLATEGSSDGIWDWDILTGDVYFSPRFMALIGYEADELPPIRQTFMDLLHPDDVDYTAEQSNLYLHHKISTFNIEYRLRHKNGTYLWCNARGRASWDENGKPYRMAGFTADISERKKFQEELQDNKDQLQAIIDASHHSIIATDDKGIIQLFNHAAEQMLGYTAEEIIGKMTPTILHTPEDLTNKANSVSKVLGRVVAPGFESFVGKLEKQDVDEQESTYVRKDGTTFPVWLSISPLRGDGGRVAGYVGIAQDISERKALDTLKSEFISVVSHELRTPLTSIRGALKILVSGTLGEMNEKINTMLTIANNNCERLIRLINDILDIEKIEAGKMAFQLSPLNLNDLAEEVVNANQAYAKEFNVELKLSLPADVIYLQSDKDRLIQIFTNLLSNAIKFSHAHGVVTLAIQYEKDVATIIFTDQGSGIPLNFQSQLFQKFSQANSSAERLRGGTGLGLSITKALIDNLGGEITFKTAVNKGTSFFIKLPAWVKK